MNDNISAFNASEYGNKIKMTIPYYEDFYKQVIDIVKIRFEKPVKWLDVGCGTGKMAETAFENADIGKFVFYDNSAELIAHAQKRFQSSTLNFLPVSSKKTTFPYLTVARHLVQSNSGT